MAGLPASNSRPAIGGEAQGAIRWATLKTLFKRPSAVVATAGALVFLALPLPAQARVRDVPSPGPLAAGTRIGHIPDVVIPAGRRAMSSAARAAGSSSNTYTTADGYQVQLEVSSSYPADPVKDQGLVDFLASRLHGPELGSLKVFVGTPAEIAGACGGDPRVLACYAIGESRMYVPGEAVQGIPVEYPLTHEYGHHIASWRWNNPWDALDWGPKYWASATRVCAGVNEGLLFPGNQGSHYLDDPGEGFADSYAHLHYPEVPWQYNELLRPDQDAFAAIRRDVQRPWTGPRTRSLRGRVGPGRTTRTFRMRLRLDGDVSVRLLAPRGLTARVELETAGFAAGRALRGGGGFGIEWCRRSRVDNVTITVRRRSGAGPFSLDVRYPG